MKPADYTEDPTLPELVSSGAPARVEVTLPATHLCPFKNEVDEGEATITWLAGESTIELHSLAAWLRSLSEWVVSHEAYTFHIRETLQSVGVHVEAVVTRWTTAGASVVVDA